MDLEDSSAESFNDYSVVTLLCDTRGRFGTPRVYHPPWHFQTLHVPNLLLPIIPQYRTSQAAIVGDEALVVTMHASSSLLFCSRRDVLAPFTGGHHRLQEQGVPGQVSRQFFSRLGKAWRITLQDERGK